MTSKGVGGVTPPGFRPWTVMVPAKGDEMKRLLNDLEGIVADIEDAFEDAIAEAKEEGHDQGYEDGREEGYNSGHDDGYADAKAELEK